MGLGQGLLRETIGLEHICRDRFHRANKRREACFQKHAKQKENDLKQTIRMSTTKMLLCIAVISVIIGTGVLAIGSEAEKAPDYSKASCWHKLPKII